MNYDNRNPVFSFRLTLKQRQKLNKVAKIDKISTNEKARNIIQDYLDNKLVPIKANYQEEKLKLQIEKLKLENQYLGIRIGHSSRPKATITMKKSLYVENNSDTNSVRSPYDAELKRLQCIDCFAIFSWSSREDWIDQLGEYQKHLVSMHNREMNTLEKDVILKLQYEGDST